MNTYKRLNYDSAGGSGTAVGTSYNNEDSGLDATNVQTAIDEIVVDLGTEQSQRVAADSTLQNNITAEETARTNADALLIPLSQKGQANGVATLDGSGKVPAAQLPSYVDDVLEFTNFASFPVTGETGKIYIALDTDKEYRWSGSAYRELSKSPVDSVFGRTGAVVAVSGDYTASLVTNTPSGNLAATNVQGALNELQTDIDTRALDSALQSEISRATAAEALVQTNLTTHISNTTGAHAASAISNVPAGTIAATTVQAAINELDSDVQTVTTSSATNASNLAAHLADTSDAHDASAISVVPTGNLTSTNVQSALEEIQTELDNFAPGSPGDIQETLFSLANNVSSPTNVTGFSFANGVVRSFQAVVSVYIDATSDLFEEFEIDGIQKGSDWVITINTTGDDSGVSFSITTVGQFQYTSPNFSGFSSGTIHFRAITLSV